MNLEVFDRHFMHEEGIIKVTIILQCKSFGGEAVRNRPPDESFYHVANDIFRNNHSLCLNS